MKPIYLKITAFGSYCDTAEVDFTRLYNSGIFLITGKTGGGKTTILDAMCMALYDKATGSERAKDWKQMRCGSAAQSTDTEIEYQFSLGSVTYKFYRRWHIAKPHAKNAEKKTKDIKELESACYLSHDEGASWELLASGSATAVTKAAERILNLTREQFVKLIMLPQGEFRELLTASSDKKEEIFKKLFDTERWETIADRISEEFRRLKGECEMHRGIRESALRGVECETPDVLVEKIAEMTAQQTEWNRQAECSAVKVQQTAAALKQGEDDNALFQELAQRRSDAERLSQRADDIARLEQSLTQSRMLRGILPQFRLMKKADADAADAAAKLQKAEESERMAAQELSRAQQNAQEIPDWEEQKRRHLTAQANLQTLSEQRTLFDKASRQLAQQQDNLTAAEKQLADLTQKKAELEKQIAKGNEFLESCDAATRQLNDVRETCRSLQTIYDLLCEREEKRKTHRELVKCIEEHTQSIRSEEQMLASLKITAAAMEQAILSDKAYALAADLQEGVPCPVCGSVHHPQPAHPAEATPTADEWAICRENVEKVSQSLERLRRELSVKCSEAAAADQAISDIDGKLGTDAQRPVNEIKSLLDAAKQNAEQCKKRSDMTAKAQERLQQRTNERENNRHDIEALTVHINNIRIDIASLGQQVASVTEKLTAQGIRDFDALARMLKDTTAALTQAEEHMTALNQALHRAATAHSGAAAGLTAARERLAVSQAEREQRLDEYRTQCAALGMDEHADVEGGVLADNTEKAYEQEIAEHRQQLAFAHKRIAELAEQLEGKSLPDIAALRTAHADAMAQGQKIAQQCGHLSARLKFLDDTLQAIRAEEALLERLSREYDTAYRMHRHFSGQNEMKTPIHQFVIGIKMDEVLDTANRYMQRLSKGQYAMQRRISSEGRGHQGLDIEILDSNTGALRGVSTLSGGELFLASLSLAFGLSDVVQSFAGGIHLDSLFIDEGFGSLDSETLDAAMEAITQVRENKLLGIISHVSELKERIPCGIEVIKTQSGSTLTLRT